MAVMSRTAQGPALTRRTLLAASASAVALLAAGCTFSGGTAADPTAERETDALAGQVGVQESLVAAYRSAAAADAAVGQQVAELAGQAGAQLSRLRSAAPSARSAGGSSAAAPAAPPAGQDVRTWLRGQVTTAADSHAAACLAQTGARAALLGSIAAGLRGQAGRLA
jgi:hypothetical protein